MTQTPHQHIPILKITVLTDDITEDDIMDLCCQFGTVSRIKQLLNQKSYYVVYTEVEDCKEAFVELQKNESLYITHP